MQTVVKEGRMTMSKDGGIFGVMQVCNHRLCLLIKQKKPKAIFSLKVLPGTSFSNSDLFLPTGSICDKII